MERSRFVGSRRFRSTSVRVLLLGAVAGYIGFAAAPGAGAAPGPQNGIGTTALQQIAALQAEKAARTPAQRKIDSSLLYAAKQSRGEQIADGVDSLETGVEVETNRTVEVVITADVSPTLLRNLKSRGAVILDTVARFRSISARVPLDQLETIAGYPQVQFVQPPQQAVSSGAVARAHAATLGAMLPFGGRRMAQGPITPAVGAVESQGDATHRAELARTRFGVDGTDVNVCVLSDGVNSLAAKQANGELPAVTVLPTQAGSGDEGTAMLEIVHDLAPGAELFYASGTGSAARMAQNILDLKSLYDCNIIVDDISYLNETPFQKGQAPSLNSSTNSGIIIQAVNDVTAQGALYFSSAGNFGNLSSGESGTWEGDFRNGGPAVIPNEPTVTGAVHDFDPGPGVTTYTTLSTGLSGQREGVLFWSDPLGGSNNDYDLYVLSSDGSSVVDASNDIQTGTQDPIEGVARAAMAPGNRLVVVQNIYANNRFLHLGTNGSTLDFSTGGTVYGHNASEATFSVAATPAARAAFAPPSPTGPYPSPFNASNKVELFSSDGPRQVFYNADGTPLTGNPLAGGGQLLQKPDATAADGVSTSVQGFSPFFGTSAAAPHAAAIAALVQSADASLTPAELRGVLTDTAIDIETAGQDRDSGAGIIDAYSALQAVATPTQPAPALTLSSFTLSATGDGRRATWSTGSESGSYVFDLYRSSDNNFANAVRVTPQSIPATGNSQGSEYSFLDTTASNSSAYYWLWASAEDNSSEQFGPYAYLVGATTNAFVPFVSR